jgi:hypothetical protein
MNFFKVRARVRHGGDDRDRTGNLRLAKPALSQLSYVPDSCSCPDGFQILQGPPAFNHRFAVVPASAGSQLGPSGFEPLTSSLSGTRSNQLSYEPVCFARRVVGRKSSDKKTTSLLPVVLAVLRRFHPVSAVTLASESDLDSDHALQKACSPVPVWGSIACAGPAIALQNYILTHRHGLSIPLCRTLRKIFPDLLVCARSRRARP